MGTKQISIFLVTTDYFDVNDTMNTVNELYNLCRTGLVYPTIKNGIPRLIPIRNDRAVVYAKDPEDPTRPTSCYFDQ